MSRSYLDALLRWRCRSNLCRNRGAGAVGHADLHPDGGGARVSTAGPVPAGRDEIMAWIPAKFSGRVYAGLAGLALAPFLFDWIGQPFYLDLLSRALIFAIAAISLNLILGFRRHGQPRPRRLHRHRRLLRRHSVLLRFLQRLAAPRAGAGGQRVLCALITGAISLRTRGVYFIMITMAFSQMVYFIFLSLEEYGADDGLVIYSRSEFPAWINMEAARACITGFTACCCCRCFLCTAWCTRASAASSSVPSSTRAHAGAGFRHLPLSPRLLRHFGDDVQPRRHAAGQFHRFISPDMMSWARSGELIFMVI